MKTMQIQKYNITNFVYHVLPNGEVVVQTKQGIVRITNPKMIEFIKRIDDRSINKSLLISEIESFFSNDSDSAIDFLLNYKIIEIERGIDFRIKQVKVFTNDKKFLDLFRSIVHEDFIQRNLKVEFTNDFNSLNLSEDDLICCFLNPYDQVLAKTIVEKVQKANSVLLMSYTYNNNIFIDNLYRNEWKNPCHICNIKNLETQLRVAINGNITYQQLIDILYHEDASFNTEIKLEGKDILELSTEMYRMINKFIFRNKNVDLSMFSGFEINESTLIDIHSQSTTKDFSIHWELCDCYE
ncbi:hypothetical protein NCCP2222_12890 [Sporosarcina sp. NCCP-2222]|uniref:McbB family protein n=1 Tax=Sporosarcina sp. NCCP-2222 TaxID=2935073 RepID=UPI002088B536|nr:McbB family protein [Sporosarcina sp. NCCP-2222]GKV55342.1 hypothetical protein NCCP2222_12890 [Sporosarcina sp. NCCP-2222]